MHTTISTEGRQVGIEFSDAVLHTTGEFCGNLHIPLQFNDPISTKAVLTHLRIKLPDNNDLYDASAHGETVGGLEMIFFRTDDSFLDPFPPDQIPDSIELFWLEDNMPNSTIGGRGGGSVRCRDLVSRNRSMPVGSGELNTAVTLTIGDAVAAAFQLFC